MKLNVLITSVLLTVCVFCKAQTAAPVIKVLDGAEFKQNGTVKYELSSPGTVYYYIGAEQFLDNKWREIILDISAGAPKKAAIVRKIGSKQVITSSFELNNIPLVHDENGNVFRFKINYGTSATSINKWVVSDPVKIK